MASAASTPRDDLRERVRFYLLDHRTPAGKAIDIALLALNLAFIGVFVAQTYSLSSTATARGTGWQRPPTRTPSSTCCRYSRRPS